MMCGHLLLHCGHRYMIVPWRWFIQFDRAKSFMTVSYRWFLQFDKDKGLMP